MRKSILIIMTVAILGGLGLYVDKSGSPTGSSLGGTDLNPVASASTQSSGSSGSGSSVASTTYKNGTFTGTATDTPYGMVQVAAVISGGKLTDVSFLQMPNDQGHSQEVTAYAEPYLKQEAIQGQSANIEFVTGATTTSEGFEQSLQNALNKATT